MKTVTSINSFDKIKLLADNRRMDILRLLMAAPATLTILARTMKQSPAWVRHHILALESAGLIEISETRRTGKVTEKFYRARGDAFLLQELILPKSKYPTVIFSGSHDIALEGIANQLAKHVNLLSMPVGSLDGLVNLRQGLCQISGSHLLGESGEYNTPFVRHLFPDRDVEVITLAYRTQGLMLAGGNPKDIRKIADITRPNVRFLNRNAGSGTRLWLDAELRKQKIPAEKINGYEDQVKTHSEAANLISQNKVDVSLGLQAAAHQNGLDFIPLFEERYDLVLPREQEKNLNPLLDFIQTSNFRTMLASLTGYNTRHSGEQIAI
ncbi:MAG: helix-turn-helix domain-containing protein [Anaerolineales bacterium]|jgi:putative molybdopterin biosynthesis protein|uniref:substrate-binding domain-containing protein n=1 Tax=Candidatus Villigracilis vicinus TaxID=3140679 RepID=UPI003136D8FE|nr:helix-turn-helix domain-containing protein [Anaerolineales bacterium]MBK7451939.1 helix-turn-helix domain-containing protein [Anaerolineales bacterium]MBK9781335.1 helix-turn-helix domain-containing protein [Anaerolineales bacterium]